MENESMFCKKKYLGKLVTITCHGKEDYGYLIHVTDKEYVVETRYSPNGFIVFFPRSASVLSVCEE